MSQFERSRDGNPSTILLKHSWVEDKPRKGWSTCSNCDLETKTYRIKKGGLPRCMPENVLRARIDCQSHIIGAILGTRACWNCGKMYSKAELAAGKRLMNDFLDRKALEQTENPPLIPI